VGLVYDPRGLPGVTIVRLGVAGVLHALRYFLEIEISSTPEGFFLSQEKYIHDLLD
jgi:hypothetical protein